MFTATNGSYRAGMIAGAILLGCAFAASFLIPKPETIPDTLAAEDVAARA